MGTNACIIKQTKLSKSNEPFYTLEKQKELIEIERTTKINE